MRVLLLDNRDSFVWNLAHAFGALLAKRSPDGGLDREHSVEVWRSDRVGVRTVLDARPDVIVLSPGPGRPEDAGCSTGVLEAVSAGQDASIPVLGVCLGHQAIGQAFGARIDRVPPCHGKPWDVHHQNGWPFEGLRNPLPLARYHSLAIRPDSLPDSLEVLATTGEGELMAVRHRQLPILGFQFHPESFLSDDGPSLCQRFLEAAERFHRTGEFGRTQT